MIDDSIMWSEEHTFWVKRDASQYLWSMNINLLEDEKESGEIKGVSDFGKIFQGKNNQVEQFAFYDNKKIWKQNTPVYIPEYDGLLDFQLYFPTTQHGELIIVNGYVVGASINGFDTDYDTLNWI